MEILLILLAIVLGLCILFGMMVLACAFALGRMHVWLKGKAEVFGDNEGLREELGDLRGHLIELQNAPILNRNNGVAGG